MTTKGSSTEVMQLIGQVGQLLGGQSAIHSELGRLNSELVRLGSEIDKRHGQNVTLIEQRYEQCSEILKAHQSDDNVNFSKINKELTMLIYICVGGAGVAGAIWTIVQFVTPFIYKG